MKPDITKGDRELLGELLAKGSAEEAWCRGAWHSFWVRHGHGKDRLVIRGRSEAGKARYTPGEGSVQHRGSGEVSDE